MSQKELYEMSLEYHRRAPAGKICIQPTKKLVNQHDLALAYSPGVAAACNLIVENPTEVASVTARGNLVGVITNGTAVLGLGAIGPLASKPVMEGKAVLFKKFAGIDVFDIEIDELDPHMLVDVITRLEPTFGGINLEDIKAPECFVVERLCKERMNIPVFHDDQHGTAICVTAAVHNAMILLDKKIEEVRIVASGAGAAALASLDLLVSMGAKKENIVVTDIAGVVYQGRTEVMDIYKARYAIDTEARTLDDVIAGADIFLGLSAPGVLKPEMVAKMAPNPLIMALANPTPEIMPNLALEVRPDAILATGRSDFPNQVNNVLCFPFIFRGALDVGATTINEEMKVAAARAIANLARAEQSDVVAQAYGDHSLSFGRSYLLPKPFDPRLITEVATAVAKAAMSSGVATRPIEDMAAYRRRLNHFVFESGQVMQPVFAEAKQTSKRVIFAEGEDERVLSAVQIVLDEGLAIPILVGRREVVKQRMAKLNLGFKLDEEVRLIDPENNPEIEKYANHYYKLTARKGTSPEIAMDMVHTRTTVISALTVAMGQADALICGTVGAYQNHLRFLLDVIGLKEGVSQPAALQVLLTNGATTFITDTNVIEKPNAAELAEITLQAASHVRRFGEQPRVALISQSNFGSMDTQSAARMKAARLLIEAEDPELIVDGEMQPELALSERIRNRIFPNSNLKGTANLLVMPSLDSANIAFSLAKALTDGVSIGPILMGLNSAAHIVSPMTAVRDIVNMTAMAAVDSHYHEQKAT